MSAIPSPESRRQQKRISVHLQVPVRIDDGTAVVDGLGEIANISAGGLLLVAKSNMVDKSTMSLRLLWPPGRTCVARGQVVWRRGGRAGIAFDHCNDDFKQLVHVLEISEPADIRELTSMLRSPLLQIRPPR